MDVKKFLTRRVTSTIRRERATSCDFYFDPSVYLETPDRREDKTLKLKEMILILEESSIFSFSLDLVWTKVLPLTCKALIDTHMCHSAVLYQTGTSLILVHNTCVYDKKSEIQVIFVLVSLVLVFFGVFSTELLTSHCKNTESESLNPSIDFFA